MTSQRPWPAEEMRKPKVNSFMTAALAAAGVVAVVLVARNLAGRRRPGLQDVVADGLADAWSRRLEVPQDRIRSALAGQDTALRDRVVELVGKVSCAFRQESEADQRHRVVVVLGCDYRDGHSERVTMRIPWRRVPFGVRTELLGPHDQQTVRIWTPAGIVAD